LNAELPSENATPKTSRADVWLLSVVSGWLCLVVALLPGCRIADPKPRWVEVHGQGYFRAIAASSRGAAAIGHRSGLYTYPGDWGRPWIQAWSGSAVGVAANGSANYALAADGQIWRIARGVTLWREGGANISAIFGGPHDELFAIVDGAAKRLTRTALEPMPCSVQVRSIAATDAAVYLLGVDGRLWNATTEACPLIDVGGPVDSVAATKLGFYFLRAGVVFEVKGGRTRELAPPRIIRNSKFQQESVMSLSASAYTLWALTNEQHAFQLLTP
jgi:hypothetical protein